MRNLINLKRILRRFSCPMWGLITALLLSPQAAADEIHQLTFVAPFSQRKFLPFIQTRLWDWLAVGVISRFEPTWSYRHNFLDFEKFAQKLPEYAQLYENIALTTPMAKSLLSSAREIIHHDQLTHYKAVGQLGVPTLIVWGKQDRVIQFEQHQELLNAMPQAKLTAIESCGHVPQLECTADFLPPVFDFLVNPPEKAPVK